MVQRASGEKCLKGTTVHVLGLWYGMDCGLLGAYHCSFSWFSWP